MDNMIKRKEQCMVELEGPYECPFCAGHFTIATTYIDQVSNVIICLYCGETLIIDLKEM